MFSTCFASGLLRGPKAIFLQVSGLAFGPMPAHFQEKAFVLPVFFVLFFSE